MRRGGTAGRIHPAATLAGALAAGVLLVTGCSGGPGGAARDRAEGSGGRPRGAGPHGGGPGGAAAPPAAPDGAGDGAGAAAEGPRKGAGDESPDMLSTFALDVDTASYGYARRRIMEGVRPEPATVRPEEFVNSFRQDYPQPHDDGFSVTADGGRTADPGWSLLRVGLSTRDAAPEARRDAALTFVVDVSGSMAEPGRLDLVKHAMHTMAGGLRPEDSVAIVAFSNEAATVLPMTRAAHRQRIDAAIDELAVRDSTNLAAGLELGYAQAVKGHRDGATNRVVLLSDALANTGETEAGPMLDKVAEAREERGITLLGVGVGSEYGDALMERLADSGDGLTVYVSKREQADKVFTQELPANLDLRARDAKAQVAFDPSAVEEFRLIGYDDRAVADEDFRDDAVDGGEIGPGHDVTALYAVRLAEGASGRVATATVRWLDPRTREPSEESASVSTGDLAGELWSDRAPSRLRVSAVAAYFADALRHVGVGGGGGGVAGSTGSAATGGGGDPGFEGGTSGSAGLRDQKVQGGGGEAPRMPGSPSLGQLASRAQELHRATEDSAVGELADLIARARTL